MWRSPCRSNRTMARPRGLENVSGDLSGVRQRTHGRVRQCRVLGWENVIAQSLTTGESDWHATCKQHCHLSTDGPMSLASITKIPDPHARPGTSGMRSTEAQDRV